MLCLAAGLALAAGCTKKESNSQPKSQADSVPVAEADPKSTGQTGPAAAVNTADDAAKACKGSEVHGPLAWFSDDYQAALDCARATSRPLVIDLWAKWCHTCLSMKTTVMVDKSLEPIADRFVWLELDTDRESNAPALAKFPPQVWPTFYVAAPKDESVQTRYLGAASIAQFRAFLAAGEKAVLAVQAGDLPEGAPLRLIRDGDRAMAGADWSAARTSYGQALSALAKDSPRRPDILVSMISAFYKSGDHAGCLDLARREMNHTGRSASAADFLSYAGACASRASKSDAPDKGVVQAFRQSALARLTQLIDDKEAFLSIDDRSDAMRIARGYLQALGDEPSARAMAERQRALIDQAAAQAPTPWAAMTFNWPRAEVHVYLGTAAELVPALQKSVADLPNEYDPPYRLAWVHYKLGQHDRALASAEKALGLGYGPRKARIQSLIADIHAARKDKRAELSAREAVIAIYKALPEGQKQPAALARAVEALAAAK